MKTRVTRWTTLAIRRAIGLTKAQTGPTRRKIRSHRWQSRSSDKLRQHNGNTGGKCDVTCRFIDTAFPSENCESQVPLRAQPRQIVKSRVKLVLCVVLVLVCCGL